MFSTPPPRSPLAIGNEQPLLGVVDLKGQPSPQGCQFHPYSWPKSNSAPKKKNNDLTQPRCQVLIRRLGRAWQHQRLVPKADLFGAGGGGLLDGDSPQIAQGKSGNTLGTRLMVALVVGFLWPTFGLRSRLRRHFVTHALQLLSPPIGVDWPKSISTFWPLTEAMETSRNKLTL